MERTDKINEEEKQEIRDPADRPIQRAIFGE